MFTSFLNALLHRQDKAAAEARRLATERAERNKRVMLKSLKQREALLARHPHNSGGELNELSDIRRRIDVLETRS